MNETPAVSTPAGEVAALASRPPSAASPRRWGGLWRAIACHPWRSLAVVLLLALIGLGLGLGSAHLTALYHLRAARSALERYHSDEAQEHLMASMRLWPENGEALFLAARAARRLGTLEEAESFLDQAQQVRGQDADVVLERVLLDVQRGEVDRLASYCRALVDRNHPAAPLVLEAMARGYTNLYRLQEAEACLRLWDERQPDNPQAAFLQGLIHDQRTRLFDAVASYRRAVELNPGYTDARLRLCGRLLDIGQGAEALPHLEHLGRRRPNNPVVQVYLARCKDMLGRQGEAEKILDDLLARQPTFAPALAERGTLAVRSGQLEEGERWLRQASKQDPGDFQIHYQLYQCLERRGKADEARALQPRLKEIEDDIQRIQEIVGVRMQQSPHNADLHYEAGMISLRAGAAKEGLRWLQSALRENPRHVAAHKALAGYFQKIGEPGRALRHQELARQAEESDSSIPGVPAP
jgi:tetratricopeptide (TPR) repeat protein